MNTACVNASTPGSRRAAALAVVVLGVSVGMCAKAEEVPYQGVAALCAMESPGVTEKYGDVTYQTRMVMIFRIETDHPLINGTERLESNSRLDTSGEGYYWGYGRVVPNAGGGTLEGKFFFRSKEMTSITFSYHGTGELSGVIMNYRLTPMEPPEKSQICGETTPLGGYRISGTVENYSVN